MKKEGEILQEYLDKENLMAPDLAENIGISKQAVYSQLKSAKVSRSFKIKLDKAGIKIDWGQSVKKSEVDSTLLNEALELALKSEKQLNEALKLTVSAQKETIISLKSQIQQLLKEKETN